MLGTSTGEENDAIFLCAWLRNEILVYFKYIRVVVVDVAWVINICVVSSTFIVSGQHPAAGQEDNHLGIHHQSVSNHQNAI